MSTPEEQSFFEAIGGRPTIELIVEVFYQGVAADEVLKDMYPEEDLGPAADRLSKFLEQYWGGSNEYSAQRGHPRLRMRHDPYVVVSDARDRWLKHFRAGLDAARLEPELDAQFWAYVLRAAEFMINAPS